MQRFKATTMIYIPIVNSHMTKPQIRQFNLLPYAYYSLLKNPQYIDWDAIQYNQNNYPIYMEYPNRITWLAIKFNPSLKNLIVRDIHMIKW